MIRRTALHRACEELVKEVEGFEQFSAGLSQAYGYRMDFKQKGILSTFTVIPDSRVLNWNNGTERDLLCFEGT